MNLTGEQKYQLLLEISQKIRDTLDLDEIMEHLLDTIQAVVDYDAAGIFVLNQDLVHQKGEQPKEVIAGMSRRGYEPLPVEKDAMLTLGKGVIGHVIFSGTGVIVSDIRQDPHYIAGRRGTRSEIAVPILRNERAIGALNLESNQLAAFDESHLEVLQFFADAASIALEKAMLHRQLLEKELLDKQLQLAREVQSGLFPSEPPRIPGYDIAGICLPAEEIGGDYYDFIHLPEDRLGAAVADVSGHGIAAGLAMTAFRGLLRMHTHGSMNTERIARAINRLLPEFTGDAHFITAVYLSVDLNGGEFTYVCCGHQPPLLVDREGGVRSLDVHGPALGIFPRVNYPTERLSLAAGEVLALYTDGVVEVSDAQGVAYGAERLKAALSRGRGMTAAALVQEVIKDTLAFLGSPGYEDDFTLVIIKRL